METIVVGYDETDAAKRALERAAQLAKAFQSRLIVTSVSPLSISVGRSAGPIDPTNPPSEHVEELRHAHTYLEQQGLTGEYITAVGNPAETIAQLAGERNADLVVVGTHAPGVMARLLGQSVSESVAHKVDCDVLLVH
jgi:nucleotide-binding universal stress UspA family protein